MPRLQTHNPQRFCSQCRKALSGTARRAALSHGERPSTCRPCYRRPRDTRHPRPRSHSHEETMTTSLLPPLPDVPPPLTQRSLKQAADRVQRALSGLLAHQPFFGIAAMHITPATPRADVHSMASDGLLLYYNPKWVIEASGADIIHAVAHCVTACALKHHTRRGERTNPRWQTASRQVTQHILLRHGLADPAHGPGIDLSVTQAYNALPPDPPPPPIPQPLPPQPDHEEPDTQQQADEDQEQQPQPAPGSSNPDGQDDQDDNNPPTGQESQHQPQSGNQPSNEQAAGHEPSPSSQQDQQNPGNQPQEHGSENPPSSQTQQNDPQDSHQPQQQTQPDPMASRGEILDYPQQADDGSEAPDPFNEETRWDDITHQAMTMAQGQGNAPGNLKEIIARSHAPAIDWRSALREFMNDFTDQHRSWGTPDRRFLSSGLFLPGPHSDSIETICFAVDTSASLDRADLARAWNEIREAAEVLEPDQVRIIQCDARVQDDATYEGQDLPLDLEAKGRRGTRYDPVFRLLHDDPPMFLLYLTDLDCTDRPETPPFPVLWICTDPATANQPPFGERLDMAPGR